MWGAVKTLDFWLHGQVVKGIYPTVIKEDYLFLLYHCGKNPQHHLTP
jgi:hypothetical protein